MRGRCLNDSSPVLPFCLYCCLQLLVCFYFIFYVLFLKILLDLESQSNLERIGSKFASKHTSSNGGKGYHL